jgi:hypothetical protein
MPAKRRYQFIPFPADNVGDLVAAAEGRWRDVLDKEYIAVIDHIEQNPAKFANNPKVNILVDHLMESWDVLSVDLSNFQKLMIDAENRSIGDSSSSVIYICGHCCPGSRILQSPDNKLTITAGDLALLFDNLNKAFSGKIKIWGCSSGVSGGTVQAFTQQFANAMVGDLRFRRCHFYGYMDTINPKKIPKIKGEVAHKWAASERRASEVRQEFFAAKVSGKCNIL